MNKKCEYCNDDGYYYESAIEPDEDKKKVECKCKKIEREEHEANSFCSDPDNL